MTDNQPLDYGEAVRLADMALTAILDQTPHESQYLTRFSMGELRQIHAAWWEWLREDHEEVFEALIQRYGGATPQNVDEYILYYSPTYTMAFLVPPDGDMPVGADILRRSGPSPIH